MKLKNGLKLLVGLLSVELLTLPLSVSTALAAPSNTHTLTYTENKLTWDSGTTVNNGVAVLDLFDDVDGIIAPGTNGSSSVILKNDYGKKISYTAVAYAIKDDSTLAVETSMIAPGTLETSTYTLPEGVSKDSVIGTANGTLDSGKTQEFSLNWKWKFYESEGQDVIDTALGDKAVNGDIDVKVGFYLVVESEETQKTVIPENDTDTGASTKLGVHLAGLAITAIALVIVAKKLGDEKDEKSN